MTELQLFQALVSAGALGIITYLFIAGRLVSQKTVDKLMEAQANHISDLRTDIKAKMTEMLEVLKDIRDNGTMGSKKQK